MDCFETRFVAPTVTNFRTCYTACKKFFSKKSAKNRHTSPGLQVDPVSTSVNCTVEVDKIQQTVHEETVKHSVVTTKVESGLLSPVSLVEKVTCKAPQNVVAEAEVKAEIFVGDRLAPRSNPIGIAFDVCYFPVPFKHVYKAVKEKAKYHASYSQYAILCGCHGYPHPEKFEHLDLPPNHPVSSTVNIVRKYGFKVYYGKWLIIPAHPVTILLDISPASKSFRSRCIQMVENNDNFIKPFDYDDSLANNSMLFGYMVGRFFHHLEDVIQYFGYFGLPYFYPEPVIAHFHGWITAFGLMFTKSGKPTVNVTTVYTSHESPSHSGNQINNSSQWIKQRARLNRFAQDIADKHMQELPLYVEKIHTMYEAAITSSKSSKTVE